MDGLRQAYRISVIIGLVMMASLLVSTVIVGLVEQGMIAQPGGGSLADSAIGLAKFILLGISAVIFLLIRFVHNRILHVEDMRWSMPGSRTRSTTGAQPEIGRLTTAAVVTYALCEVPAIFGLALFFLGGHSSDFHLFLFLSLFLFAVHFPRFSQWEEWHRKQEGSNPGRERS